MAVKILENIGIETTGLSASAINKLITAGKSGIVGGYLNECALSTTGNTVIISTGKMIIGGVQLEIDTPVSLNLSSVPTEDVRYQVVVELRKGEDDQWVDDIFVRLPSTLIQENFTQGGYTYQLELGRVTHKTTGQVTEVLRTADILYGQSGAGADIEVGEVNTQMISTELPAEVNINKTVDNGKTKLNFDFSLPKPYEDSVTGLVYSTQIAGNPVNIPNTNDGFVDKVKITNDTASAISSPLTGKSVGKNEYNKDSGNILNAAVSSGAIISTHNARIIYIPCLPNTTYTISRDTDWGGYFRIFSSVNEPAVGVVVTKTSIKDGDLIVTYTTNINANYLLIYCYSAGTIGDADIPSDLAELMIQKGSVANPIYEPYTASAFSIPLKDTSGTVLDLNPADVIEMIDGKYHLNSTELHDESQDALRSIATKEGQTNLIGDQPFTFDVTEFQLGLESIDAMLTLPNGKRVNVVTKDRVIYITSGEYAGKTLDYALQELQNEIDGKQDALTFDDIPTSGSDNPVKSGGVKTALDEKAPLASPTFTGSVKVPTATQDNEAVNKGQLDNFTLGQIADGSIPLSKLEGESLELPSDSTAIDEVVTNFSSDGANVRASRSNVINGWTPSYKRNIAVMVVSCSDTGNLAYSASYIPLQLIDIDGVKIYIGSGFAHHYEKHDDANHSFLTPCEVRMVPSAKTFSLFIQKPYKHNTGYLQISKARFRIVRQ